MIKKILTLLICMTVAFSCTVCADEAVQQNEAASAVQEKAAWQRTEGMPPDGFAGRGMMGGAGPAYRRPQGEAPQGEMPQDNNRQASENTENTPQSNTFSDENNAASAKQTEQNQPLTDREQKPFEGENFGNTDGAEAQAFQEAPLTLTDILREYSSAFASVILLVFAFIFVIFYKRRNY